MEMMMSFSKHVVFSKRTRIHVHTMNWGQEQQCKHRVIIWLFHTRNGCLLLSVTNPLFVSPFCSLATTSPFLSFIFLLSIALVFCAFLPLPSFSLPPQFKDQVVREAVEKICREFSGQCCIHKPLGGGSGGGGGGGGRGEAAGGAEAQQVPEVSSSTLPGAPSSSSTPPCSSCRGQTTGGGYQCR